MEGIDFATDLNFTRFSRKNSSRKKCPHVDQHSLILIFHIQRNNDKTYQSHSMFRLATKNDFKLYYTVQEMKLNVIFVPKANSSLNISKWKGKFLQMVLRRGTFPLLAHDFF